MLRVDYGRGPFCMFNVHVKKPVICLIFKKLKTIIGKFNH